jgi:hypothetical protein
MARYMLLARSALEGIDQNVPPGTVVEYAGTPGFSLWPLDEAAQKAWAMTMQKRGARVRERLLLLKDRARNGLPHAKRVVLDAAVPDALAALGRMHD